MTRRAAVALLLVGWFAAGDANAIANGVPVDGREFARAFPWLVAIVKADGELLCTGALISRRWVLTAGHCVGTDRYVLFGNPSRAAGRRVAIRAAITHPQFRMHPAEHDLGLLRLARPVRVPPAAVATRAESFDLVRPFGDATIAGWGNRGRGLGHPDGLLKAAIVFSEIRTVGTHIAYWTDRGGPCGGDSGGPLLVEGYDGKPLLVGVASITDGDLCARGGGTAAYTDVAADRDFVLEHVPDLAERLPPLTFGR